ncbi:hypothetical protein [Burkholderia glumae]
MALMFSAAAQATISASLDGGTSYIHLGRLAAAECKALIGSPVMAGMTSLWTAMSCQQTTLHAALERRSTWSVQSRASKCRRLALRPGRCKVWVGENSNYAS